MKFLIKNIICSLLSGGILFLVFSIFLAYLPDMNLSFIPEVYVSGFKNLFSLYSAFVISVMCAAFVFLCGLFYRLKWLKGILFLGFVVSLMTYCIAYLYNYKDELEQLLAQKGIDLPETQKIVYEDFDLYQYDGFPDIYVVPSGALQQSRVDEIVYASLSQQPSYLLENCSSIYLMDQDSFDEEQKEIGLENVVGLANSSDMSVKILIQEFEGPFIDTSMPEYIMDPIDYYINTITHELSHIFDYQYAYNQVFYSDDETFLSLYEEHGTHLGDYASSNAHEFFAESSKLYLLYNDYLYSLCPESYVYFQSIFSAYAS